jgi:CHRD domain
VKRMIHRKQTWFAAALAAGVLLVLTASGLAGADPGTRLPPRLPSVFYRLTAQLSSAQVVPAPSAAVPASATGRFDGVLARFARETRRLGDGGLLSGWRIIWRLTYSGLSSTATSAEINTGAHGATGPHVAGLCGPCSAETRGSMELTSAEATALLKGNAYVQVATANNPSGEIRGQIHRLRNLPVR